MPRHRGEHVPRRAVRRPVAHAEPAAWAQDARQLRRGPRLVGREHGAERRQHHVEAAVVERERLRVALDPVDLEVARLERRAREQLRRQVESGDVGAGAGRRQRRVAGAARDVEHAVAGSHRRVPDDRLAGDGQPPCDPLVVARGPHVARPLLGSRVGHRAVVPHGAAPVNPDPPARRRRGARPAIRGVGCAHGQEGDRHGGGERDRPRDRRGAGRGRRAGARRRSRAGGRRAGRAVRRRPDDARGQPRGGRAGRGGVRRARHDRRQRRLPARRADRRVRRGPLGRAARDPADEPVPARALRVAGAVGERPGPVHRDRVRPRARRVAVQGRLRVGEARRPRPGADARARGRRRRHHRPPRSAPGSCGRRSSRASSRPRPRPTAWTRTRCSRRSSSRRTRSSG